MSKKILTFEEVTKIFERDGRTFKALDKVSFDLYEGDILGIIGESGSGKSTLSNLIMGLFEVTEGRIFFDGKEISHASRAERRSMYQQVQMVFQNAAGSFNPRRTIGATLEDTLCFLCSCRSGGNEKRIAELLELVGLPTHYADKYPFELSGGECQRAAIARAMAVCPKAIICDEATSALDVSAQAKIVTLLKHLQEVHDMTLIFITHDLPLVSSLATRLIIMDQGKIVEEGETIRVITNPQTEVTKRLVNAVL